MIENERLDNIINHESFPAVSILIPTLVTGDYEVNRIKWKNELNDVYQKLEEEGYDKKSFLQKAEDLINDSDFWANQSSGLVGYFSENICEIINLLEAPIAKNVVADSFVTTPLILSKLNKQRVFLLTLSQDNVRFFEAINSGIYPVRIEDLVPPDMAKALFLDIEKESLHPTGQGMSNTQHHKDKSDIRIEQFFRIVDEGLWTLLEGENVPLVIAAVEEHHSAYKNISRYKHISQHMITGNVDNMSPAELRMQLDPVFEDLKSKEQNLLDKKLKSDYKDKKLVDNEKDLLFNLEIDNVDTCIIPSKITDNKEQVLLIEQILRTCYKRKVDIAIKDDFVNVAAITRNDIVIQNNS